MAGLAFLEELMISHFQVLEIDRKNRIVFLEDLGGPYMSITNNAERMLEHIKKTYGALFRLVYQDTEGEWWEIVGNRTTWMGTGIGFEPWNGLAWDILNTKEPQ
jgi:hypothetical protein